VGLAAPIFRFRFKTVQIFGEFVANLQLEGAIAEGEFLSVSSVITQPGFVQIDPTIEMLRVRVLNYTSGEPRAILAGFDARSWDSMDSEAIDKAAENFSDVVPLVKAHILGDSRAADSNVIAGVDDANAFVGTGALDPPYNPVTLCALLENSNSLRQNIDAYQTNIDAFGHRFEPVIDLDADDADQHIANALCIETPSCFEMGPVKSFNWFTFQDLPSGYCHLIKNWSRSMRRLKYRP
jgi:hypothetical protein